MQAISARFVVPVDIGTGPGPPAELDIAALGGPAHATEDLAISSAGTSAAPSRRAETGAESRAPPARPSGAGPVPGTRRR
ncbi:hypothetical protein [Amycolatopsis keratiniphila]|uniref:hypothetical protein n=1 Tax=Amycolatopsis keratiniphila TaxID=129921 RepID=UPI000907C52F|nr:hypothetical protein [Amycolatopsis keratiniphila]OLZ45986.1 hypothetical protein BS330_38875 [Amycolatopsis keratiniphila subsp. nogabecina]